MRNLLNRVAARSAAQKQEAAKAKTPLH